MHQMRGYTRKLSYNLTIALFALFIMGCNPDNPRNSSANLENFLHKKEAGLFGYGKYLFRYSSDDCQISVNKRRKHLRMQNDSQTYYVHVEFSDFPNAPKQRLEVRLSYKLDGDQVSSDYSMEVMEIRQDKMWLWDNKKHTGIIIPVCW